MYELTALSFIMIFVRTKLGNPGQTYFLKIAVLYPFDKWKEIHNSDDSNFLDH